MSPSELFLKIASLPVVLAAAFVLIVVSALFFMFNPTQAIEARFKEALNHDLFIRTGLGLYGPRKLYTMLDAYTEADYRAHYKSLYLDFVYPLIYAVAMALIIVYLQNELRPPDATVSPYPVLIPLTGALADYLENISQYFILRRYQTRQAKSSALVFFSMLMTAVKILLFAASLLIIIAGLLKLIFE
ncbi:MAG TPA: hypothetical protein VF658_08995 [Pyrinomonadaceae bacterium]|jgi:hypothetical protein